MHSTFPLTRSLLALVAKDRFGLCSSQSQISLFSTCSEPEITFLVGRVPPLRFTQSKEPSSLCCLPISIFNSIIKIPGYPKTIPRARLPDFVVVKSTAAMGLGLFAKQDIKEFELILAERPLLIVPQEMPLRGATEEEMSKQKVKSNAERAEEMLGEIMVEMNADDTNTFRKLGNCFDKKEPKLYSILRTNGFRMSLEAFDGSKAVDFAAVGSVLSRINHSCTPNVHVDFDPASFCLMARALRDLKAGEQLFCAYCVIAQSAKARQAQLDGYGFICKCTACVNATPESDRLREQLALIPEKMGQDWQTQTYSDPKVQATRLLQSWRKMEKELVKEGLDIHPVFIVVLHGIKSAYEVLNNPARTKEYEKKLVKYESSNNFHMGARE